MATIHPTAVVDASAELADTVEIGAYSMIEAGVRIGEGTIVRPHAVIRRGTQMGRDTFVDSFAVLGGSSEELPTETNQIGGLQIGDGCVFREMCTVHAARSPGDSTILGSKVFLMTTAHIGHDAKVCDGAILANGVTVGPWAEIGEGAILPSNGMVADHCRIGRKVMTQGGTCLSMHVPPFVMCSKHNNVNSLNLVGIRRSEDMTSRDRKELKEAFHITYRSGMEPDEALKEMQGRDWGGAAGEFRQFLHEILQAEPPYDLGLCPHGSHRGGPVDS